MTKLWKQFEQIGILKEVRQLEGKANTVALAQLQADILFNRNRYVGDFLELTASTSQYLYSEALKKCHNVHTDGLLAVLAYGIEEGKRIERARRKGGVSNA